MNRINALLLAAKLIATVALKPIGLIIQAMILHWLCRGRSELYFVDRD